MIEDEAISYVINAQGGAMLIVMTKELAELIINGPETLLPTEPEYDDLYEVADGKRFVKKVYADEAARVYAASQEATRKLKIK